MNISRWLSLLSVALVVGSPQRTTADEPNAVHLFDRSTLTGWDYGPQPAAGWQMSDGMLFGKQGATPLVSGWSWDDVELTFRWRVEKSGTLRIAVRAVPDGATVAEVTLRETKK